VIILIYEQCSFLCTIDETILSAAWKFFDFGLSFNYLSYSDASRFCGRILRREDVIRVNTKSAENSSSMTGLDVSCNFEVMVGLWTTLDDTGVTSYPGFCESGKAPLF
jgi:hypothetical protein